MRAPEVDRTSAHFKLAVVGPLLADGARLDLEFLRFPMTADPNAERLTRRERGGHL